MIGGWLSKYEEKLLTSFAAKSDGLIVEVGSYQGKSTVAMASATKNKIVAIDPHYLKSYKKFIDNTKKYVNISPIKDTSENANKKWRQKISLLHIDGNHEYEIAKEDIKIWWPYLKNNGVIVCHDAFTFFPDVFMAVKEELFSKDLSYVGAVDSQIFAVKGKPKNLWQKFNVERSKFFLILASSIWHNKKISKGWKLFLVNRLLKIFILNKFMFKELLHQDF